MSRTSIASSLRRVDHPGRRWAAAGGALLGSVGLLGGLLVGLPGEEPTTPELVEAPESTATSSLLTGPNRLVLPLPGDEPPTVETVLRHRRSGVEVRDATSVNAEEVTTELSSTESGDTRLVVTSTAVHRCSQYAGSVVVTASHPDEPRDHLFIDLRFADCDGVSAVPAAPESVNDLSRTWGDDGRAPWAPPPSTSGSGSDPDPEPEPGPTTETPTAEPTNEPTTEPTAEPTTAPEPEPEPTTPKPDPQPTNTTEPGSNDDGQDTSGSGSSSSGSSDDTTAEDD